MQLKPDTITFATPLGKTLSEMSIKAYSPGRITSKLISLSKAYPGQDINVWHEFTRLTAEKIEQNKL